MDGRLKRICASRLTGCGGELTEQSTDRWLYAEGNVTLKTHIPVKTGKSPLCLLAALGLALISAPAAFAAHDEDQVFAKMDTNHDGKISRAEHAAGSRAMFQQCDANHDGVVTAAEMDAAMVAQGQKPDSHEKSSADKIQVIDQNGDGKLTADEQEAGAEKMFAMMDKDGDGFLSKEECKEATRC